MLLLLSGVIGIVNIVCWIMTIVKAFSNGETVVGILCLCPLVAFIMGWVKSGEWNHGMIMIIWSVCFVANIGLNFVASAAQ